MMGGSVATVFIPSMLRALAGDRDEIDVSGSTVGEIVDSLTESYPELGARLTDGGQLRASLSVAIDGEVSTLGLLDRVEPDSEVHFVPAIAGGLRGADANALG